VLSIKRSAAASPATGSAKAHDLEQKTLISLALREDTK
jgi:2-oxoglutarate dehydrogenase E1 component